MKIAVVAADGRVAKKVIAEALNRGHEVTAFGRHDVNETPAKTYIKKDILNLTREDLQGLMLSLTPLALGHRKLCQAIRRQRSIWQISCPVPMSAC